MTWHDIRTEMWAQQHELDLSLLSEPDLLSMYHNVYECGCDECNEKLDAIAEEFWK